MHARTHVRARAIVRTHACMHTRTHMRTHAHTPTHTLMRAHTHARTHARTDTQSQLSTSVVCARAGSGYRLVISKLPYCDVNAVKRFIQTHIGYQVTIRTNISAELSFTLPACTSKFPTMFSQMDLSKRELGIQNYTISLTTLDEVFLR